MAYFKVCLLEVQLLCSPAYAFSESMWQEVFALPLFTYAYASIENVVTERNTYHLHTHPSQLYGYFRAGHCALETAAGSRRCYRAVTDLVFQCGSEGKPHLSREKCFLG